MIRRLFQLSCFLPGYLGQACLHKILGTEPLRGMNVRRTQILRYYWDDFLRQHQCNIRGVGLEIGSVGSLNVHGKDNLERAVAIDIVPSPAVQIVADLTSAWHVDANQFDVFINQFSIHCAKDDTAFLFHSIRMLKPGGVLLINFPCMGVNLDSSDFKSTLAMTAYRRYTPKGVEILLARMGLNSKDFVIKCYGNRLSYFASWYALEAESVPTSLLMRYEGKYALLVCAKITKPQDWTSGESAAASLPVSATREKAPAVNCA